MPSRRTAMPALVLLLATACGGGAKQALPSASPSPSATASPSASPTAKPTKKPTPKPTATKSATPTPSASPSGNGIPPATGPAPAHFQPLDFSFLGHSVGWSLGQVCSDAECDALMARTTDSGKTWHASPAPAGTTTVPDTDHSIRQVRFGNLKNGWVFGPSLYATHDGGSHWKRLNLGGDVVAVEEAKDTTWVVVRGCAAGGCRFYLYVANQASDAFVQRAQLPAPSSEYGAVQLVRHGASVAWVATKGSGAPRLWRTTNAGYGWTEVADACHQFGDGSDQIVSRVSATDLWILCTGDGGAGSQTKYVFHSTDGGLHWGSRSEPSRTGQANDFVALTTQVALLSTTHSGLLRTTNGGITWSVVAADCCDLGFGKIESVNLVDAWAIGYGANAIFRSPDRGAHWTPYKFTD